METSRSSAAKHGGAGDGSAVAPVVPHEIELKLLASPETLDQLRKAPVVVQHARNRGITRRLEAIYYDTPDHLLVRRGLSLRVRRSGKHHIQTVKRLGAVGDPLTRQQWETPVDTIAPDLARLPGTEIGAPFDTLDGKALAPIFATKVRRHLQVLELPGAVVEIAFDDGMIEAGERSEPVSEVELELKTGDVAALYEFGLSLLDVVPLQVGMSSKSARGYALALETPPAAAKSLPVRTSSEDNADEAIARILRSCQQHLMANLAAAESGRDPDGVHQMRVALRRLRTAVSVLRRDLPSPSLQAVAAGAKQMGRSLGSARGWDVFVTATLSEIDAANLPDVSLDALRSEAERLRGESYAAVRDMLADPQGSRFLLSLGRLVERRSWRGDLDSARLAFMAEPARALAHRVLTRVWRKAMKQGRHFRHLEPEARHRLRLTLKKLRYTTEFFQSLHGASAAAQKYLKRLSKLQDALGADNDVTTTRPLLRSVEQSSVAPDVHRAVGAIVGWQGRHQIEAAKALRKKWRSFKQATPFWST